MCSLGSTTVYEDYCSFLCIPRSCWHHHPLHPERGTGLPELVDPCAVYQNPCISPNLCPPSWAQSLIQNVFPSNSDELWIRLMYAERDGFSLGIVFSYIPKSPVWGIIFLCNFSKLVLTFRACKVEFTPTNGNKFFKSIFPLTCIFCSTRGAFLLCVCVKASQSLIKEIKSINPLTAMEA